MSSKNKHTPGPWKVVKSKGYSQLTEIVSIDGPVLSEGFGVNHESDQANAHLIAAAPEMLEALEFFVNERLEQDPEDRPAIMAKRILAKARGES